MAVTNLSRVARVSDVLLVLVLAMSSSGCTLTYTTREGHLRTIGLMSVDSSGNRCFVSTSVASMGISLDLSEQTGGINVGYRRVTNSTIASDAVLEVEESGGKVAPRSVTCNIDERRSL